MHVCAHGRCVKLVQGLAPTEANCYPRALTLQLPTRAPFHPGARELPCAHGPTTLGPSPQPSSTQGSASGGSPSSSSHWTAEAALASLFSRLRGRLPADAGRVRVYSSRCEDLRATQGVLTIWRGNE